MSALRCVSTSSHGSSAGGTVPLCKLMKHPCWRGHITITGTHDQPRHRPGDSRSMERRRPPGRHCLLQQAAACVGVDSTSIRCCCGNRYTQQGARAGARRAQASARRNSRTPVVRQRRCRYCLIGTRLHRNHLCRKHLYTTSAPETTVHTSRSAQRPPLSASSLTLRTPRPSTGSATSHSMSQRAWWGGRRAHHRRGPRRSKTAADPWHLIRVAAPCGALRSAPGGPPRVTAPGGWCTS